MGLCFLGKVRGDLLRESSTSWIWYDSGTTSESKLCFCRAFTESNCNLVRHGRSTTSKLGLSVWTCLKVSESEIDCIVLTFSLYCWQFNGALFWSLYPGFVKPKVKSKYIDVDFFNSEPIVILFSKFTRKVKFIHTPYLNWTLNQLLFCSPVY